MKYFLNADDFGLNSAMTEAIDQAISHGLIQRTSLMTNTAFTQEAAALAFGKNYPDRVTFHLNLSDGPAMTQDVKQTVLCGNDGNFRHVPNKGIQTHAMAPSAVRAIRRECEAQMKRFRELGFSSNRLDAHEWVIYNMPIWTAIKPLLESYGFDTVRRTCDNWIRLSGRLMHPYYRMMDAQIRGKLAMTEDWSGTPISLEQDTARGLIWPNMNAEIYLHLTVADGVLMNKYIHYDPVPLTEIVQKLAEQGELVDLWA